MSKLEVNTVAPQCGTTLTLGESGDTVTLGTGASQSGFGREGSVNWDTSIKTTTFTAVSGNGYFCNTSGGAFTMNLPSSPSVGDIVAIKDYASSFEAENLTIGRGGSNMNGSAVNSVRQTDDESLTMVYADATQGWLAVEEGTGFIGENFISATGGTITTSGDYKIHTFTGPGTFCVSKISGVAANNTADYLVVAGGGGAGRSCSNSSNGAGGAGGFRASNDTCMSAPQTSPLAHSTGLTLTAQGYPITVGAGGTDAASSSQPAPGNQGSTSTFNSISSAGGGAGAGVSGPGSGTAGNGGSGGGAIRGQPAGSGNTPPVSPPQGNNGGTGIAGGPSFGGGGGGGAGAAGTNATPTTGGPGGIGSYMVSTGFAGCNGTTGPVSGARYFSGGGGGGSCASSSAPDKATGGAGGGGNGGLQNSLAGTDGDTNSGGGGGGPSYGGPLGGGHGGSGIVIIRYKYQ